MGKTVADLTLDDEHMTVGVEDTLQEAAKRMLTISGGITVVLDDDQRVKGVIGQRQLVKALSEGVDAAAARCHEHMEMDFMQVELSSSLKSVLSDIRQRSPQAVVAVDEQGEFVG
ncbi:MAG: CBS domain-containing protein [Candidatus Thermoplasmatota archaeon]|nr:CBS domain-containing protein [Candidatus Thermoplasmatota archaeon]